MTFEEWLKSTHNMYEDEKWIETARVGWNAGAIAMFNKLKEAGYINADNMNDAKEMAWDTIYS